jgi:TRAP-type C4-dicarboxylate transport system permease small subunit
MDLFLTILPRRGKIVDHVAMGALNLFTLGLITFVFFRYIGSTFNNHMVSWVIHIPYYPFVAAAAIGMVLFFATALANFFIVLDELKEPGKTAGEKEALV